MDQLAFFLFVSEGCFQVQSKFELGGRFLVFIFTLIARVLVIKKRVIFHTNLHFGDDVRVDPVAFAYTAVIGGLVSHPRHDLSKDAAQ